jgi:hypothetical protein
MPVTARLPRQVQPQAAQPERLAVPAMLVLAAVPAAAWRLAQVKAVTASSRWPAF